MRTDRKRQDATLITLRTFNVQKSGNFPSVFERLCQAIRSRTRTKSTVCRVRSLCRNAMLRGGVCCLSSKLDLGCKKAEQRNFCLPSRNPVFYDHM